MSASTTLPSSRPPWASYRAPCIRGALHRSRPAARRSRRSPHINWSGLLPTEFTPSEMRQLPILQATRRPTASRRSIMLYMEGRGRCTTSKRKLLLRGTTGALSSRPTARH
eukprot:2345532-Prymnesium_polylepis.2